MAGWSEVINLIKQTYTENAMGDIISTEKSTRVYADRKSIRQSEFYQAQATGLQPEIAFEIHSIEYDGEMKLEYNSKDYTVIRTFDKGEFIELICQGVVNDGS